MQRKRLIKVKDEWFQADSEANICFMSFICFCNTVHSVTPCLSRYNGENLSLKRWVRCSKTCFWWHGNAEQTGVKNLTLLYIQVELFITKPKQSSVCWVSAC